MGEFVDEITALLREDMDDTAVSIMTRAHGQGIGMDLLSDFTPEQLVHTAAAGLSGITNAVLRIAIEVESLSLALDN
jgi:hypothetical protein